MNAFDAKKEIAKKIIWALERGSFDYANECPIRVASLLMSPSNVKRWNANACDFGLALALGTMDGESGPHEGVSLLNYIAADPKSPAAENARSNLRFLKSWAEFVLRERE